MGACMSAEEKKERSEILERFQLTASAMGMSNDELLKMYACFRRANVSDSKYIQVEEWQAMLNTPRTSFTERLFHLFRDNNIGISFESFLVFAWNLCARDAEGLGIFAFEIYDRRGTRTQRTKIVLSK
jgi:hypothetical protein